VVQPQVPQQQAAHQQHQQAAMHSQVEQQLMTMMTCTAKRVHDLLLKPCACSLNPNASLIVLDQG
jgi:hypothetical protein